MFVFDNGEWAEVSRADGLPKFRYRETGRGDESIFMEDDSRGVKIRLDIRNSTIFYTGNGGAEQPLYPILRSE